MVSKAEGREVEAAPAPPGGEAEAEAGDETGSPSSVELPLRAYPWDEEMSTEDGAFMAEYRRAVEPDLSPRSRLRLNAAREEYMTRGEVCRAAAAILPECSRLPAAVALEYRKALQAGTAAVVANVFHATMGLDAGIAAAVRLCFERHAETVNVLIWIAALEVLHSIAASFLVVGWLAATSAVQAITAPFLLRCYYALVASIAGSEIRRPALSAARALGASALRGFGGPAKMRPPLLLFVLLCRVMLLLQTVYYHWYPILLNRVQWAYDLALSDGMLEVWQLYAEAFGELYRRASHCG